MQTDVNTDKFFQSKVLGHPAGLFVLFFTEMWERFSFYGMRVLLVLFLTMSFVGTNPGWEFSSENAGALFGTYASLLYLTPILGGILADKYLGYRMAVVVGALIMTLGHACMALETEFSLYFGLGLLVIGTGFFKPNITSIISQMYKDLPRKKDGAYTIFYMGVNAGAFFGMMLCGYLGEKIGWVYGFGLAGVFMLFGAAQFWLSKPLFGSIGEKPIKETKAEKAAKVLDYVPNKFTPVDRILIALSTTIGFVFLINDPLSKIGGVHLFPKSISFFGRAYDGPLGILIVLGLIPFLFLSISRIMRYEAVVRARMFAVIIFAIFTVFFFLSFEQGATSLVMFADKYTDRTLVGNEAVIFNVVNIILTLGPLVIISWVLYRLFRETWSTIKWSNITLGLSFVGVWILAIWIINRDLNTKSYEVQVQTIKYPKVDEKTGELVKDEKSGEQVYVVEDYTDSTTVSANEVVENKVAEFSELAEIAPNTPVKLIAVNGKYEYLDEEEQKLIYQQIDLYKRPSPIIQGTTAGVKSGVDIPASWFSILNSFFIIAFASFFSKWWESKYNPSPAMKFALGLFIMGVGFGVLAYGSIPIGDGTAGVRVGIIWLILAYFFHTLGELCVSPVGLSMVSKLVPGRMIAFMFGMWYLAIAIGNKLAASLGGSIEGVVSKYDMTTFYLIFTIVPIVAGVIIMFLNPVMKKLMKGVE
jgi:proton-dependent oligopeptide transporter, POT family